LPQAPQLLASLLVSTHTPLHKVWPSPQPHMPAVQTWPPGQTFPQAPQLLGSLLVSTQVSPHKV
jgi:hypothetical protein